MRLTEREDGGYRNGTVLLSVSIKYANELYYKLRDLEDIEEKHSIKSVEDLDKKLTAFEIIKERRCSVSDFILDRPSWEDVLRDYDYWFCELPAKDEYDLLKEVLL